VCYGQHISKKRNCYNRMKSTVTISNTPMLRSVFLNRMKHTRTCTYKMKSVTTNPCNVRYTYRRNCSSTTKMKLTATQQDGWPTINTPRKTETQVHPTSAGKIGAQWSSRLVIGSDRSTRRSCDTLPSWQLLSSTGNTCLSILALVPWITNRCHLPFAHTQITFTEHGRL